MLVNFFELTCSNYIKKGKESLKAPFFQILSSFASPNDVEFEKYEIVKQIIANNGKTKASKLLKFLNKICFITNYFVSTEKKAISNLDVSLFIVLALENSFKENSLSVETLNGKYRFDRYDYTRQIKKLQRLTFSCYNFSEKEFFDNYAVFDYLIQKGTVIEFSFSSFFTSLVLAGGKTFRLPYEILTSVRSERNAVFTLGQIFISTFYSVQNQISSEEFSKFEIRFSLKDFYSFCGVDLKRIRFDKLCDITIDTLLSFSSCFDSQIIINRSFPLSKQPMRKEKMFETKSQLIHSEIEIVFEQKDLFDV